MAEIDIRRKINSCFFFRHFYIGVLITLLFPSIIYSQTTNQNKITKRKIEIIWTDRMETDDKLGSDYRRLIGHDTIKSNDV
jgi:hypothetical protein